MPSVRMLASGEEILALEEEELQRLLTADSPVRALKRRLQGLCGQPRFRQRLVSGSGRVLEDQATIDISEPGDLKLVLLSCQDVSGKQVAELIDAAHANDVLELEALLQRPQDPNLPCELGFNALHRAADDGNLAAARLLLEAGADRDLGTQLAGATPLALAAARGRVEMVRLLLEAGANAEKANKKGVTPIAEAVKRGHRRVACLLLEARRR